MPAKILKHETNVVKEVFLWETDKSVEQKSPEVLRDAVMFEQEAFPKIERRYVVYVVKLNEVSLQLRSEATVRCFSAQLVWVRLKVMNAELEEAQL